MFHRETDCIRFKPWAFVIIFLCLRYSDSISLTNPLLLSKATWNFSIKFRLTCFLYRLRNSRSCCFYRIVLFTKEGENWHEKEEREAGGESYSKMLFIISGFDTACWWRKFTIRVFHYRDTLRDRCVNWKHDTFMMFMGCFWLYSQTITISRLSL